MKLIVIDEQICFGGNTHLKGEVLELGGQVGRLLLQKNSGLRLFAEGEQVVVSEREPKVVELKEEEIVKEEKPKEEKKEEKKKEKKGLDKLFFKKKVK